MLKEKINMKKYFEKYQTTAEYDAANNKWPHISYIEETEEVKYEEKPDYSTHYFTTVALSDGNIGFDGSTSANTFSYSTDNGNTWSTPAQNNTVTVSTGDSVMWKGTPTPNSYGIGRFSTATTANFDAEGNAMSLLYGDNFVGQTDLSGKDYAFYGLFTGSTKVISAENLVLPATTLSERCYSGMFNGCTNLTTAPQLPAMTLVKECYFNMFNNCTSLTTAPQLPATKLAYQCYASMFNCCSSLTEAPQLPATTLDSCCYSNMFNGCTNLSRITCLATRFSGFQPTSSWVTSVAASGTFYKAASMTSWTTGVNGIPQGWTVVNA